MAQREGRAVNNAARQRLAVCLVKAEYPEVGKSREMQQLDSFAAISKVRAREVSVLPGSA